MSEIIATLVVIPPSQVAREVEISDGITSIGRALDNTIAIDGDSNISRYHAEIESRGSEFWIYDLGSSNGITVNDEDVTEDRLLKNGDTICVGGETLIEFHYGQKKTFKEEEDEEEKEEKQKASAVAAASKPSTPTVSAPSSNTSGVLPILLVGTGVLGVLAIAAVVGLGIYFYTKTKCPGAVTIISPKSGITINAPVTIKVDYKEGDEKCIDRVIYQINDGIYKIEKEAAPYQVELDPEKIPGFKEGGEYSLTVIVVPLKGDKVPQDTKIIISYGTPSVENPPPSPDPTAGGGGNNGGGGTTPSPDNTPIASASDVKGMTTSLATQIGSKTNYVFTPEFVDKVNRRMGEYRAVGGAGNKALRFKREINKAFRDRGVSPLIGYILAFSRSKFNENATVIPNGIGLWQLPPDVVRQMHHLRPDEQDTALKDPVRGAEIAAAYLNDLIGQFQNENFMYAIACVGMSLEQVGQFKVQLEKADPSGNLRLDFMQTVKQGIVTPEMLERVERFIAAGVIGENPQSFGMPDQKFSSL